MNLFDKVGLFKKIIYLALKQKHQFKNYNYQLQKYLFHELYLLALLIFESLLDNMIYVKLEK